MSGKDVTKRKKEADETGAVQLVEEDLDQVQGGEYVKLDLKEIIVSSVSTGGSSESPSRARSKK